MQYTPDGFYLSEQNDKLFFVARKNVKGLEMFDPLIQYFNSPTTPSST